MSESGYIYILSNKSMPGVLKIGRSKLGGKQRASQLFTTGVPHPFKLEFEMFSRDYKAAEIIAHEKLDCYRSLSNREFFRVDLYDAVAAVSSAVLEEWDMASIHLTELEMVDVVRDMARRDQEHPFVWSRNYLMEGENLNG